MGAPAAQQPPTVFVSYSWKDKTTVDEVDIVLQSAGVRVRRDIRDIEYRQSIRVFMKSIRQCDYVLLVLSDAFLKSPNCMYEVLEFVKDENHRHRVLPILLDPAVFRAKADYIAFWEKKMNELKVQVSRLELKNTVALVEEIKVHDSIAGTVGEFLSFIQDLNCLTYEDLKRSGFAPVLRALNFDDIDLRMRILKAYFSEKASRLREHLTDLQKEYPNNRMVKAILGELANEGGQYDEAIDIYSQLIAEYPNNAGVHNGRGYAYYMKGDYERARVDLETAIRLEPAYAAPCLNLGNIDFYTGALDRALELYTKAVSLEPDEPKYLYSRANCYRDLGNSEAALADYKEALRLNPRYALALCNRGELYRRLGMTDLAEADFATAIVVDPTDDKPVYNIALISMDRKQYPEAIKRLSRYLAMKPDDGPAYFTRGLAKVFLFREKMAEDRLDSTAMADVVGVYEDMQKAMSLGDTRARDFVESLASAFREVPDVP